MRSGMNKKNRRLHVLLGVLGLTVLLFAADRIDLSETDSQESVNIVQPVVNPSSPLNVFPKVQDPALQRSSISPRSSVSVSPLPLQALGQEKQFREEFERDIFAYHEYADPPEDVEQPEPPPIALHSITPNSVYAGTGEFTLEVTGSGFPEDAQLIINGEPMPTFENEQSELMATVSEQMISSPGQIRIEVKDQTGELYSNPRSLIVEAPPKPSYKFVGRIDDLIYFQKGKDERLRARIGDTIEGRWIIAEVEGEDVILEDSRIGIQHTIELEDHAPMTAFRQPVRTTRRYTVPRRTVIRQQPPQPQQQNQGQREAQTQRRNP